MLTVGKLKKFHAKIQIIKRFIRELKYYDNSAEKLLKYVNEYELEFYERISKEIFSKITGGSASEIDKILYAEICQLLAKIKQKRRNC